MNGYIDFSLFFLHYFFLLSFFLFIEHGITHANGMARDVLSVKFADESVCVCVISLHFFAFLFLFMLLNYHCSLLCDLLFQVFQVG